jgi:hypothetical protein
VTEVYVEATGRHFLLIPVSNEVAQGVSQSALEVLGETAHRLESDCELEEFSDFSSGGLWFQPGSLTSLSLLEARILAARWGTLAAEQAGLRPGIAARFVIGLRSELSEMLLRVHGQGGTRERGWHLREFPAIFDRSIDRLRGCVSSVEEDALRVSLLRLLNE